MTQSAGPGLRSLRRQSSLGLADFARLAGVSKGHLSRIERGDRPVTPAILRRYEEILGVPAATVAATVAATALTVASPAQPLVTAKDAQQVEQAAALFTGWDLRYGGGLASELGAAPVRWAAALTGQPMTAPTRRRLHGAVAWLACRIGWATFDAGSRAAARPLFDLALHHATEGADLDLHAYILAERALVAGSSTLALELMDRAEDGTRLGPALRFVVSGVRARAYGVRGELDGLRAAIGAAEEAYANLTHARIPHWLRAVVSEGQLYAVTGLATASAARAEPAQADSARFRLGLAVGLFGPDRARATALCAARLAPLHLLAGAEAAAADVAATARGAAVGLRSARVAAALRMLDGHLSP